MMNMIIKATIIRTKKYEDHHHDLANAENNHHGQDHDIGDLQGEKSQRSQITDNRDHRSQRSSCIQSRSALSNGDHRGQDQDKDDFQVEDHSQARSPLSNGESSWGQEPPRMLSCPTEMMSQQDCPQPKRTTTTRLLNQKADFSRRLT